MKQREQPMKACDRCGLERIVRHDRRNNCQQCRGQGLHSVPNWMEHGLCRSDAYDADWWWPESADAETNDLALNVCGKCSVRDLCLDFAIQHKEEHGIWGGLMPAGRRAIADSKRARSA